MQPTFSEIQKFNKWWHYILISTPLLFFITLILLLQFDVIVPKHSKKDPWFFIPMLIASALTIAWFLYLNLKTTINENGIHIVFSGIPFCKKIVLWDDISTIEVVEYSPLSDYGGWGVKYSIGNGWCYNVSGTYGIKITGKTHKPFLVGTLKKEEAEKVITYYFKT